MNSVNATLPSVISSLSSFIISSTISFTVINLLFMMYLAGPFLITLLLFRNNEYVLYATMVLEGVLWAIAVYSVVTKIHSYTNIMERVLSNVTQIAVTAIR